MENGSPKKSKKRIASWPLLIILLIVIAIIILLGWLLTRDKVTVTGSNPEVDSADSITCKNTDSSYPFFTYDNSIKKSTEVILVFSDGKLDKLSFAHTLYYSDDAEAKKSESINHAAFNTATQEAGLGPDILTAHYSTSSNNLRLTLHADIEDINAKNVKYLLLDGVSGNNYTKSNVQNNYKNNGFKCNEVN